MASAATALKMKDTHTSAPLASSPSLKAKHTNYPMADVRNKASAPTGIPEIIEIDGVGESNNKTNEKLVKKGAEKPPETDKENGANSEYEENEGGGDDGVSPHNDEAAKYRDPATIRRRKINDFIADKAYRVRSFLRRRGVPLTRITEMDIQECKKNILRRT